MLIWFTGVARYLRPHLSELYCSLHSPPAALNSVQSPFWQEFLDVLDEQAVVVKLSLHCRCQLVAGLLNIHIFQCVPRATCPSSTPYKSHVQWLRAQDLQSSSVTLTKDAISHFLWFATQCFCFICLRQLWSKLQQTLALRARLLAWGVGSFRPPRYFGSVSSTTCQRSGTSCLH